MNKPTTRTKIIIRPVGQSVYRRRQQPLLGSSSRGRVAEVAGGTAAECVAVWCCCPCTVVNLVVTAVYKLPAGICRKAMRKRRRQRMMKEGLLPLPLSAASSRGSGYGGWDVEEFLTEEVAVVVVGGGEVDSELIELEKEMWSKFYSTGFWRSPSQRE
ncbi:hypothetical protein RND81_06G199600 [Saponaria officinalis]|uniref:Uncharacterized protein n=1 Tax=Saponaria officinalis TaxID=3572 RepID=A0AAW1KDV8_SAPOF